MLATMAAPYLDALNPEQRRAVEHGVTADFDAFVVGLRDGFLSIEVRTDLAAGHREVGVLAATRKPLAQQAHRMDQEGVSAVCLVILNPVDEYSMDGS